MRMFSLLAGGHKRVDMQSTDMCVTVHAVNKRLAVFLFIRAFDELLRENKGSVNEIDLECMTNLLLRLNFTREQTN